MPRYDGTGPQGKGPQTGRGMGFCKDVDGNTNSFFFRRFGLGRKNRRDFGGQGHGRCNRGRGFVR